MTRRKTETKREIALGEHRTQRSKPILDADDITSIQPRLHQVREIQRTYAAAIIASGIFGNSLLSTEVIGDVAADAVAPSETALRGLFHRLEAASPDSTQLAFPLPDDPQGTDLAENILTAHGVAWSDAGFLVGLAVGECGSAHTRSTPEVDQ